MVKIVEVPVPRWLCPIMAKLPSHRGPLASDHLGGRPFIYGAHTIMQPNGRICGCKRKKLDQYAEQQPTQFVAFEGFDVGVDCIDYVRRPDADGHWLSSCETVELMSGMTVRVLINPKTPRTTGHCAAAQDS